MRMLAATWSACKGSPTCTRQRLQLGRQRFAVFGNNAHAAQFGFRGFGGLGHQISLGVQSCSTQRQGQEENRPQPIVPSAFHALYNTDEA